MRVVKGNILVKPDPKKESSLIMESKDPSTKGTVKVSGIEGINAGDHVIFGEDCDVIEINGDQLILMPESNVKIIFGRDE